ncbi:MAG: pyridoxal-phosphate dependent enzyme [Nitrospira sp.]|nr:pyridoxal-phosphate dependent enzyme [Nitrospiraceae bacterium]MBX3342368.1 pyridoxal-phosphate dependent enzyme [Nitrospira sp.]
MAMTDPITIVQIEQAAARLQGVAHMTPVVANRRLDEVARARVFLKCENFQRVGAFKFRGAYNAVSRLAASGDSRPIVTISSGNHAQGVALACRLQGRVAHVVMPAPVNVAKRAAVLGYGAALYEAPNRPEAERLARDLVLRHDAVLVHPYNDPDVMAGQGTVALEFLSQVPNLDVLLAPVSGGGLMSGLCVAAHARKADICLYACEPAGALDAMVSVRENRIVPVVHPHTIADGLRATLGDLALPILRQHLSGFFVVQEQEIIDAMRFVFERIKVVIEPSSAVAIAPLLRAEGCLRDRTVGVILTGGNADLSVFWDSLSASLH